MPYRIVNHGLCLTCGDDVATDDPQDACCGYGFYELGGHRLSEAMGQGYAVKVPLLARDTHVGCAAMGRGGLLLGPCTCGPGEACIRPCESCGDPVEHARLPGIPAAWPRLKVPVFEWTSVSWNGRVSPLGATITHGGRTERWRG